MKKILLLILILFHQALFSQAKLDQELDALFLGLHLESGVAAVTSDAKLGFKPYDIKDPTTGEQEKIFIAHFTENKLIGSKILAGKCTVTPKKDNGKHQEYTIAQEVTFRTLEEVVAEYHKLSSGFEKFGGIITEPVVQGHGDNKGYQNKVNMIQTKTTFVAITFMYPIPVKDQAAYRLNIICRYRKLPL